MRFNFFNVQTTIPKLNNNVYNNNNLAVPSRVLFKSEPSLKKTCNINCTAIGNVK